MFLLLVVFNYVIQFWYASPWLWLWIALDIAATS